MIWCDGGPATLKRQMYPPPVEISEDGGIYVLHDEGPPTNWRYVFMASGAH